MGRRDIGRMRGERYLGNTNHREVHDLDHESGGENRCQIDEIIDAAHEVPFETLEKAHEAGYKDCAWCIGR